MPLDKVKSIITDIKNGNTKPIYFLMGEEPYYIDGISKYIEENVLSRKKKGFNQMVLYGRDVTVEDIISNAKRYPMMAEKQVVIVKEAQDLSRTIENLVSYADNPQPTTILVFCYKYKTLDKRKNLPKLLQKQAFFLKVKNYTKTKFQIGLNEFLREKAIQLLQKPHKCWLNFLGMI